MKKRNSNLKKIGIISTLVLGHKAQITNFVENTNTPLTTDQISIHLLSGSAYHTVEAGTNRIIKLSKRQGNSLISTDVTFNFSPSPSPTMIDHAQIIDNNHIALIVATSGNKIGYQV